MSGQDSSSGYYHLMIEQVSYTEEEESYVDTGDLHSTRTTGQPTRSASTMQRAASGGPDGGSSTAGINHTQNREQGSSPNQSNCAEKRGTRVSFNGKTSRKLRDPSLNLCKAIQLG